MNKKTKDKIFRLAEKLDILVANSHEDPGFFLVFNSHEQVNRFNYEWNKRTRAYGKLKKVYLLNQELFGMKVGELRLGRAQVIDGVPYSKNKVPWNSAKIASNMRLDPKEFIVRAYSKTFHGKRPRDFFDYEKAYNLGQLDKAIAELMFTQAKDKAGELYLASYLATGRSDYILADPGHSPSPHTIPDGLTDIDDIGFGWGFDDEYSVCDNCNMVIRTSPDSYIWQPEYYVFSDDGMMVCDRCIIEDYSDDYIEKHINKNNLVTIDIDLNEFGFVQLEREFENGYHNGQNDDPEKIIPVMSSAGFDIVFTGSVGQFDISWKVWARPQIPEHWHSEYIWTKDANDTCNNLNAYQGYDTATEFSRALSGQHSDHVSMVSRTITPEQFISGDWAKEKNVGPTITSITIGESND